MGPMKHILIVEDGAAAREALRAMLEAAGYRAACARNGQEALDALRGPERPWLILLDLSMPVLDGWQFRARQRQTPSLAAIPVILLSGEPDLPRIAASLGADAHLAKPFEFTALLRAIRAVDEGRTRLVAV